MQKKFLLIIEILIISVSIFPLFFIFKRSSITSFIKIDFNVKNYEEKLSAKEVKSYTMEEINKNNSKEKCWAVIRGKVYDLTQWIDEHPGGADKILSICGKDGTQAFVQKHGGKEKPEKILKEFEIGVLKTQ